MPAQPMSNNPAITYLRWFIATPAGLLAWFGANQTIEMAFGLIHGYEVLDSFWDAPDMDGMLITGTYIIVITRIVAAASLVAVTIYMVPRYHKQVATIATALVSAAAIGLLGFIWFEAFRADAAIGPEGWYRYILDALSIIIGALFGAWMAYGSRTRRVRMS
jgi:hypothetical protein